MEHHRQDSLLPGKRIDSLAESATIGELQWSSGLHLPGLYCGGDGTEKRILRGNPGTIKK